MLCCGIGTTAAAFFHTYGIQVITGVTGDVNRALDALHFWQMAQAFVLQAAKAVKIKHNYIRY